MFGRASKMMAHVFYTTPNPVVTRQYYDPFKIKEMVVELRGVKKDGTVGYAKIHNRIALTCDRELTHS